MIFDGQIRIPLDVPQKAQARFKENFRGITLGTGRLMLFAGDQKIEYRTDDFSGPGIHPDIGSHEHLFRIASGARIGVFATRLGLIARYGEDYATVPYLVRLNGRTNLFKTEDRDLPGTAWHSVDDVMTFQKHSDLQIHGVGYTIYPGSIYEPAMLHEAAQVVRQAHEHGLVTVIWIVPRGAGVRMKRNPHLIAGACAIAASLGSDFVTVSAPKKEGAFSSLLLREAVLAAGRTRVICTGGSQTDVSAFLTELHEQIHTGGTAGCAAGRNFHQLSLPEGIRMCNAISSLIFDDADVETAVAVWRGQDREMKK